MSNRVTDMKPGPADYARTLKPEVFDTLGEKGLTLTGHLERLYPQRDYRDGLDGFQRVVAALDLSAFSDYRIGLQASTVREFAQAAGDTNMAGRMLLAEYLTRQWRGVSWGSRHSPVGDVVTNLRSLMPNGGAVVDAAGERGAFAVNDAALGSIMNNYQDNPELRAQAVGPAIPLSEIVAFTTTCTSSAYRTYYLANDATQTRMVRVAEGDEIPRMKLTPSQREIRLEKFGRGIDITYEAMLDQRVDWLARHVRMAAIQAQKDKVAVAIDTLINGDGNAGTSATVVTLTSLDSGATPPTPTAKSHLAFRMELENPYMMTTVLAPKAQALILMLLQLGSANIPLAFLQNLIGSGPMGLINQNLADGSRIGWTSDVPTSRQIGFDARFALERVVDPRLALQEIFQWTTRQVETITFTEKEGYAIADTNATRYLNASA